MTTDDIIRKAGYFVAHDKNGAPMLLHARSVESIVAHPVPEHGNSVVVMQRNTREHRPGERHPCRETVEALMGKWQFAIQDGETETSIRPRDDDDLTFAVAEIAKQAQRLADAAWTSFETDLRKER